MELPQFRQMDYAENAVISVYADIHNYAVQRQLGRKYNHTVQQYLTHSGMGTVHTRTRVRLLLYAQEEIKQGAGNYNLNSACAVQTNYCAYRTVRNDL